MSPHDLHLLWRRAKDICFEHCPVEERERLPCNGGSGICVFVFKKVFDNTLTLKYADTKIEVNCEVRSVVEHTPEGII